MGLPGACYVCVGHHHLSVGKDIELLAGDTLHHQLEAVAGGGEVTQAEGIKDTCSLSSCSASPSAVEFHQ